MKDWETKMGGYGVKSVRDKRRFVGHQKVKKTT